MKKKLLSFCLGICMCFVGMFSLTGCKVVKTDENMVNSNVALKVGNSTLTKGDIISDFYTYYQNNGNYFAYYDESTIEESFYEWAIVRQILNDRAFEALSDGKIYYTNSDAEEVWEDICEYFYSQVNSYEKNIYSLAGYATDGYPKWLQTEEDKDETSSFAPYESKKFDTDEIRKNNEERKNNVAEKLTKEKVVEKLDKLKAYLFQYVDGTDENGNEKRAEISSVEANYIPNSRNQAYANFVSRLVSNAKANGTDTDETVCLENELYRVYEAYYKSKITTNYQNYYLNEYLSNYDGKGDKVSLSDSVIAKAFLEDYYAQKQSYNSEAGFIKVMTDKNGASLILYSYNGENYFFSVQHILVKFTDYLSAKVASIEGKSSIEEKSSSSSSDPDATVSDYYKAERNRIADENVNGMLTEVKDNDFDSIVILGDYYYFDSNRTSEYGTDNKGQEVYNGYIKLKEKKNLETNEVYYSYIDENGEEKVCDKDVIQHLATKDQVIATFNDNYATWKSIAEKYYNNANMTEEEQKIVSNSDMKYVFETIDNIKTYSNNASYEDVKVEIENKIASYLFIELEWVYSTDPLKNELANKIGYIISNYPNENGSLVADFAVGARELMKETKNNQVKDTLKVVVSDYGYHIMKIENVYKNGFSIGDYFEEEIKDLTVDFSENSEFVNTVINFMKKTYVASGSNETLYDYVFDKIYDGLVGTSSSSGSYFVGLEYKWLSDYSKHNLIEYVNKLSYSELMATVK